MKKIIAFLLLTVACTWCFNNIKSVNPDSWFDQVYEWDAWTWVVQEQWTGTVWDQWTWAIQ